MKSNEVLHEIKRMQEIGTRASGGAPGSSWRDFIDWSAYSNLVLAYSNLLMIELKEKELRAKRNPSLFSYLDQLED